ncbi:MAG: thioredoxin domain-containing protein [Anaerolineales bacterium]|nr:thioredoxin domain-containing protein [Anaerolineales bacterium]
MATKKSTPAIEIEEEEEVVSSEDYVTFKMSHFYAVLVVLAFAVGILVGYIAWGRNPVTVVQQPAAAAPVAGAPQPTPEPVIYNVETKGFPSLGPDDAPITIVEFSDYQCPYCYRWHAQVYDQLLAAYPDKIRFVYRNFPLNFHPNAFPAAEAALCAGDQGAYWEFHKTLFDNQSLLNSQAGTTLAQADYNSFATALNLDITAFEACMTSHKYEQFIKDDMAYAASLPYDSSGEAAVGGTPTFFINGHRLGGAYPFEYFKQIIDAELANN